MGLSFCVLQKASASFWNIHKSPFLDFDTLDLSAVLAEMK